MQFTQSLDNANFDAPLHVATNCLQDGEEEFVLDLENDAVTISQQPALQEGNLHSLPVPLASPHAMSRHAWQIFSPRLTYPLHPRDRPRSGLFHGQRSVLAPLPHLEAAVSNPGREGGSRRSCSNPHIPQQSRARADPHSSRAITGRSNRFGYFRGLGFVLSTFSSCYRPFVFLFHSEIPPISLHATLRGSKATLRMK